ncbi:hypothetical protein [Candidatus Clostridium stratigraminis]|uniref:Uncharacterized protein n=1 Tax=Candidatus Clostridium stratigraminis TaxID=3381661 RepID=A0ABW8SYE7_9CLOT
MKITAEFNSVEEILHFTKAFGETGFIPQQGGNVQSPIKAVVKEKLVDDTPKVNAEKVSEEAPKSGPIVDVESTPVQQEDNKEDPKVTKEMVRERLGAAMKAGKQKEVKALVAKYGASKVPDIKEEDYAAVYNEAEALL